MKEGDFVQELRDWMRDGGVEEWQELCLPPWSRQEDSQEPEQAQPQADPGSGQEGPFERETEAVCLECGDRPAELSLGLQGFGEVCSDCLRKWHR